jgi:hypothetical protein
VSKDLKEKIFEIFQKDNPRADYNTLSDWTDDAYDKLLTTLAKKSVENFWNCDKYSQDNTEE